MTTLCIIETAVVERLDRVLVTDQHGNGFVLSRESAANLYRTYRTFIECIKSLDCEIAPRPKKSSDECRMQNIEDRVARLEGRIYRPRVAAE